MGFLDKLMFWKGSENLITPNNAGLDIQMPDLNSPAGLPNSDQALGLPNMNPGLPPHENSFNESLNTPNMNLNQSQGQNHQFGSQSGFPSSQQNYSQQQFTPISSQQDQSSELQKDIQIISLKLDAIKSELDAMNQRIVTIEKIAQNEQTKQTQQTQRRWY